MTDLGIEIYSVAMELGLQVVKDHRLQDELRCF